MTGRLGRLRPVRGSLTGRIVAASGWTVLEVAGGHLMRLSSNLILTRLLVPEAFGLMAFASTLLIAGVMLTDLGVVTSMQREPDAEQPRFVRTAWTVHILRSVVVAAAMLAMAAGLGAFGATLFAADSVYAAPETPWIVASIAALPVIDSLSTGNLWLAQRRLDFRRITLFNLALQGIGLALTATLAWIWPTVWALVAGGIAGAVLRSGLSHRVFPGTRMAPAMDRDVSARLWTFGKWIMLSSPFGFLANHGDKLILAALTDVRLFALYTIARIWVEAVAGAIGRIVGNVALPALGEVARRDDGSTTRAFGKLQRATDAVCLAGFAGLLLFGDGIIHLLYPDAYADAAVFVPILAILVLRERFLTFGRMLLVAGDSRFQSVLSIQNALAVWLGIPLAHAVFGLTGALYAVALAPLVAVPSLLGRCRPLLPGRDLRLDLLWLAAVVLAAVAVGQLT
jgi:O-antigen/teichoic acid export membrane protein